MKEDLANLLLIDAIKDFRSRLTTEHAFDPDVVEIMAILEALGRGNMKRVDLLVCRRSLFRAFKN